MTAVAVGARDGELLRALHDEHAAALWAYVTGLLHGDRVRAQDVVQETLLRAWRNPDAIADPSTSRSWLYTVAKRIVIDDWRAARRRPEVITDEVPEMAVDDATEQAVDRQLVLAAVQAAVRRAPRGAAGVLLPRPERRRSGSVARRSGRDDQVAYPLRPARAAGSDQRHGRCGMSQLDADPFEHDDAAYVMGLLSGDDLAAFEAPPRRRARPAASASHSCGRRPGCWPSSNAAGLDGRPARQTRRRTRCRTPCCPACCAAPAVRRRRERWLTAGISGLAVASLVALVIAVWPGSGAPAAETAAPAGAAPRSSTRRYGPRAAVTSTSWGTRISLDCDYYGCGPGERQLLRADRHRQGRLTSQPRHLDGGIRPPHEVHQRHGAARLGAASDPDHQQQRDAGALAEPLEF